LQFTPESCFLAQFGIPRWETQPFGHNANPKDILIWHTKTESINVMGSNHGYVVDEVNATL